MFAQVIQGRTSDPKGLQAAMDRWMAELQPGAVGWLGSTIGVTDDGQALAVARFESAEAAGRNAQRPEQTAWWEATQRLFDGDVTFQDSEDVTVEMAGIPTGPASSRSWRGQVTDFARAKEIMARFDAAAMAEAAARRPRQRADRPRRGPVDPGHLLHLGGGGTRERAQGTSAGVRRP